MAIFTGRNVEEAIETGLNELGIPRLKARIKVISKEKKGFLGFGKKPAQVDISRLEDAQAADKKPTTVTSIFKDRPKATTDLDEKDLLPDSQVVESTAQETADSIADKADESSEGMILPQDEDTTALADTAVDSEVEMVTSVLNEAIVLVDDEKDYIEDSSDEETKTLSEIPQNKQEETDIVLPDEDRGVETDKGLVSLENETDDTVESLDGKESATTAELETAADQVTSYVQKIIYEMDVDASIEITISRRRINLQIETTEAGRVIGYHGKVLKALQLLAQNYLYDHYDRHYSVSINVHDYVEHRTETLIDFTQKIAARVIESGRPYDMDPMSNSERKTVHKTISQIDGVSSYSEGDDPNRYVVVTLSEDYSLLN